MSNNSKFSTKNLALKSNSKLKTHHSKLLITGGAGYIGSHLVKQLLQTTDYEIVVLDNLVTGFDKTIQTLQKIKNFKFINQDLKEWDKVEKILDEEKFDTIIHFAASLIVPESMENPAKYYLNNTANTTNLANCAAKSGVKKFIFSSTAAVYGEPNIEELRVFSEELGISEDFNTNPINPYGQSKLFSEKIIQDISKISDMKYVIFRYFNVAGADKEGIIGQSTKNATHLIKVAAETALGKRDKMYIFGDDYDTPDGTCIRDYIDVDDLAKAHIDAIEYLCYNNSNIFNVGYSKGYSVKEVIETMKKVSGNDFKVEIAPKRAGDPALLISDNSKIKKEMNWQPKYDNLELICKKALEWERKI